MTTVIIDLPGQQASALQARATAAGLTLEAWFRRLAEQQSPISQRQPKYDLGELIRQCDSEDLESDEDRAWIDDLPAGRETL